MHCLILYKCQQTEALDMYCRYRMDYMKFVEYHRAEEADITVGCLPIDHTRASEFGLMNIDSAGVITVSLSCLNSQLSRCNP